MQTDESRIAVDVYHSGSIVIGRIRIVVARHYHAIAETLKFRAETPSKLQHHVLFYCAARSARAAIGPTVAGIENDDGAKMDGRWRRSLGWYLRWCSRLRWSFCRRRGLLWRILLRRRLLLVLLLLRLLFLRMI